MEKEKTKVSEKEPYQLFLADRILRVRLENGMTQHEFARVLCIGRDKLAKIEIGLQKCDVALLFNVAKKFNCSTDYFLGIKD